MSIIRYNWRIFQCHILECYVSTSFSDKTIVLPIYPKIKFESGIKNEKYRSVRIFSNTEEGGGESVLHRFSPLFLFTISTSHHIVNHKLCRELSITQREAMQRINHNTKTQCTDILCGNPYGRKPQIFFNLY
jgi:hypothetical protein